ncbi:hypothetical protein RJ639_039588 [Escallonia herrerae]|uniref:DUF3741 domain-containing protein n=1 Tax=Escallonia herrerae TaxID=1293975 RepID=A0AA88WN96_9ASTE|nr:hypothetical protein RJ639_039588 [Escallonia herrerae]
MYRGSKSANTLESSNQLVPYGRGQSSAQVGDLSMALLFALENGGKLGMMDSSGNSSVLGFLHQIGRRSLDLEKMQRTNTFVKHRPSTSQFPTLSHLHIKEISKGVQNLNQILKACSSDHNFNRYSIVVGKELLKGAKDLEESLKMLVNLQEASEYMTNPQRKNRITLLEEDEEDEANTPKLAEKMQLDLPRFSFDKPTRNSHSAKKVAKTDLKQRLMALTYPTDTPSIPSKQASSTSELVPQLRPNIRSLPTSLEPKSNSSSSQSKSEKGRISNVIAKLMGMEELPEKVESHARRKESSSKQKEGTGFKAAYATDKNAGPKLKETDYLAPIEKKELLQVNKMPPSKDATILLKAENFQFSRRPNSEVAARDAKPHRKDFEKQKKANAVSGDKKATITTDEQQNSSSQANRISENLYISQEKERGLEFTKQESRKGEITELVLMDELQQKVPTKHGSPEVAKTLQDKFLHKESTLQKDYKIVDRVMASNQKPREDHRLHHEMLLKPGPQEEKHQAGKREQRITQQNFQGRKHKGNLTNSKVSPKPKNGATSFHSTQPHTNQKESSKRNFTGSIYAMPSKELPDNQYQEVRIGDESSTNRDTIPTKNVLNRNLDQKALPREQGPKLERANGTMRPHMQEKLVIVPTKATKVGPMQLPRSPNPQKIDIVALAKKGTSNNLVRPLKHHIPTTEEAKQKRHGSKILGSNRSKETEGFTNGSNKSEANVRLESRAEQMHTEADKIIGSNTSGRNEHQRPKVVNTSTSDDNSQDLTSDGCAEFSDVQGQSPDFGEDPEITSQNTSANPREGGNDSCHYSEHKHKKVSSWATQEPLTEDEKHLKEIVIKIPLFLNTAEALFKLNIPVGILHGSDHNFQDEDIKLISDCGCEVMYRKGRRQELGVQPCVKVSISYIKVRSLDDLVKQLNKDFERLKFYNKGGSDEYDAADYLHQMLERDIQNRYPDLNSLWDFGWNDVMFALADQDDVIRNVEKEVLNGLLDEITQDILHENA